MSDEQIRIPSLAELATIAWAAIQTIDRHYSTPHSIAEEAIERAAVFRKILEQRRGT